LHGAFDSDRRAGPGAETALGGQGNALRIGNGPGPLGTPPVQRHVLSAGDRVPGFRCRALVSLSVGRCRSRPGRVRGVRGGAWCILRGDGLYRDLARRLRLHLAERRVQMDVAVPDNVAVTKLDWLASWCRKNSLWPMPFATACCGIELMATGA